MWTEKIYHINWTELRFVSCVVPQPAVVDHLFGGFSTSSGLLCVHISRTQRKKGKKNSFYVQNGALRKCRRQKWVPVRVPISHIYIYMYIYMWAAIYPPSNNTYAQGECDDTVHTISTISTIWRRRDIYQWQWQQRHKKRRKSPNKFYTNLSFHLVFFSFSAVRVKSIFIRCVHRACMEAAKHNKNLWSVQVMAMNWVANRSDFSVFNLVRKFVVSVRGAEQRERERDGGRSKMEIGCSWLNRICKIKTKKTKKDATFVRNSDFTHPSWEWPLKH